MSKYRVELHIKETGSMSVEDFRRLRDAVDVISEVTDFRIVIDGSAASMATLMYKAGNVGQVYQVDQPMETGKHIGDRFPHNVTQRDVFGQE